MASSLINSYEELDLLMQEIIFNADGEDILRDAIATHIFAESLGLLYMKRNKFGRCQDDGTIYINEGGWKPIGRNESKFGKFAGSICGSKVYSMFAQSINYLHRDTDKKSQVFTLLTHENKFYLIKNSDNIELIKGLFDLYDTNNIAPYQSYTTPNIHKVFFNHPLVIYRSWDIDKNFKFSEVINCILHLVNEAVSEG